MKTLKFYKFLAKTGQLKITIEGNSMLPVLKNGDIINVSKITTFVPGTVILFVFRNQLVVHRLIKIEGNVLYCKGDNSFVIEKIDRESVIGEVKVFCRNDRVYEIVPKSYEEVEYYFQLFKQLSINSK